MTENQPKPRFFDRSWWQAVTSNAVGTLFGGGLVLLVGVIVGIFTAPGGWRRVALGLLLGGFAAAFGVAGVTAFADARSEQGRLRQRLVVAGAAFFLLGTAVVALLIFLQFNADFTFCDRHADECNSDG